MKADKREDYLLLTRIPLPGRFIEHGGFPSQFDQRDYDEHLGLCHFCKYARWSGGSACSGGDGGALDCASTMRRKKDYWGEGVEDVWAGESDCCWFKPQYKQDVCVDITGIYLRGEYPDYAALKKKR